MISMKEGRRTNQVPLQWIPSAWPGPRITFLILAPFSRMNMASFSPVSLPSWQVFAIEIVSAALVLRGGAGCHTVTVELAHATIKGTSGSNWDCSWLGDRSSRSWEDSSSSAVNSSCGSESGGDDGGRELHLDW